MVLLVGEALGRMTGDQARQGKVGQGRAGQDRDEREDVIEGISPDEASK